MLGAAAALAALALIGQAGSSTPAKAESPAPR
jgi:hypothetical protein